MTKRQNEFSRNRVCRIYIFITIFFYILAFRLFFLKFFDCYVPAIAVVVRTVYFK